MKILDDKGRAALKVGDEVLVRITIEHLHESRSCNGKSSDGLRWGFDLNKPYVYAKLNRPIAVGDRLRMKNPVVHGLVYNCVGFLSDGQVACEWTIADAGRHVVARPADAWEHV